MELQINHCKMVLQTWDLKCMTYKVVDWSKLIQLYLTIVDTFLKFPEERTNGQAEIISYLGGCPPINVAMVDVKWSINVDPLG